MSVKTRVGYDSQIVAEWIPRLLEMEPACIALHGRTLKQQYSGVADWEAIGAAAALAKKSNTLILGNGDVSSLAVAFDRIETFGLAGVLIGRASMGNPYVFQENVKAEPTLSAIALEHSKIFEETYQDKPHYSFLPMRKNLGWYVRSMPKASTIRSELFQASTSQEVAAILERYELL